MTFWFKAWLTYVAVAVTVLGVDFAYLQWREASLEPLAEQIDLSVPGKYRFATRGYHSSAYFPSIYMIAPKCPITEHEDYQRFWAGQAPEVFIRVLDDAGAVRVSARSRIVESEGWSMSCTPSLNVVEAYGPSHFDAEIFGSYTVELEVLAGSPAAKAYRPVFKVQTFKDYVLLGPALVFLALCGLFGVVGLVLMIGHVISAAQGTDAASA